MLLCLRLHEKFVSCCRTIYESCRLGRCMLGRGDGNDEIVGTGEMVGSAIGLGEGMIVGSIVGVRVGEAVGIGEGRLVGDTVGKGDGS